MVALTVMTARGPAEVADLGSGPALLVVHGLPGDWRQGLTVAEDLAGQARVLLVSRPGYGATPLGSGRSPAASADLYAALLDALGLDRAVVLGISGGGPSSYAFAARHPERCAGLVLCGAVAAHELQVPAGMRRLAAVPGLWSVLAALSRGTARLRRPALPDDLTPAERAQLDDASVRAALERFVRDTPTWLSGRGMRNDVRQLRAATSPVPWPDGACVPTAVLHGEADTVVPATHAHAYGALVPGAVVEVLPGLGHALPLFARQLLAARLSSALALPTPGTA